MGRRKKYGERVQTQVRIPVSIYERLEAEADQRSLSINFLMEKAVEDLLDRLIPVEELRLTRDGP